MINEQLHESNHKDGIENAYQKATQLKDEPTTKIPQSWQIKETPKSGNEERENEITNNLNITVSVHCIYRIEIDVHIIRLKGVCVVHIGLLLPLSMSVSKVML